MFKGNWYLITGGANGIGLETAKALHAQGAQLAVWDVDAAALQAVAETLHAHTAHVDVTQPDAITSALDALIAQTGRLDGVIHCAGILRGGRFEAVSLEQHRRVVEINLFGTLAITHAVLPYLRKSQGALVLVSSLSAAYGAPEFAAYGATKAGMLNFAQSLRIELTGSGVYLGIICPHFVDTSLYRTESTKGALTRSRSLFNELATPQRVANTILRGIEQREFMIWSGWRPRVVYAITRYLAFLGHRLMLRTWQEGNKHSS